MDSNGGPISYQNSNGDTLFLSMEIKTTDTSTKPQLYGTYSGNFTNTYTLYGFNPNDGSKNNINITNDSGTGTQNIGQPVFTKQLAPAGQSNLISSSFYYLGAFNNNPPDASPFASQTTNNGINGYYFTKNPFVATKTSGNLTSTSSISLIQPTNSNHPFLNNAIPYYGTQKSCLEYYQSNAYCQLAFGTGAQASTLGNITLNLTFSSN